MKYKAGDRVLIKSIDWYNENKDEDGIVELSTRDFIPEMVEHCGTVVTIKDVFEDIDDNVVYYMEDVIWDWTDEMFEGLVEEEIKPEPKFNDEDKIHPWTIQDAKDGDVIFYDDGWTCIFKCIHGIWFSSYCFITDEGEFHTGYETHAVDSTVNGNANLATKEQCDFLFQKIEEAGYKWNPETKTLEKLIEPLDVPTMTTDFVKEHGLPCPEGYIFKDENGNVINATKIILEKKPDDKLKLESIKKVREYWSEYTRIFIEIYDDEPNECILTHLYTLEGHRQKGYGRQALIEAELIAKELGCHTAYLKVETDSWMHEWYLRMGYKWYKTADKEHIWLIKNL